MGQPVSKNFLDQVLRAFSGAALGSALGLFLVAAVDCSYAGAREFAGRWLADAGLLAPLSLAVAVGVAIGRLFFHQGEVPRPLSALAALRERAPHERAEAVAFWLIAPLAFVFWLVATASVATRLLGSVVPAHATGGALALAAIALFWLMSQLVAATARSMARTRPIRELAPSLAILFGAGAAILLFGYAVSTGNPGGAGGALALFGVFKRPELDLRAPGLVLVLAAAAYLMPHPGRRRLAFLAIFVGICPLALTVRAANHALDSRTLSLAIEREAPLGKLALSALRRGSDRDHDGYAAAFGGGDCDDHDPARNPGAIDVPGNGIDEDCSGSDDRATATAPVASIAPSEQAQRARKSLPQHLNVVLISIDTLRHDMNSSGYSRPVTPNLDKLSEASVVFDQAYSLASYTAKSVGPFLIGKYSSETHRDWSHFNRFSTKDVFVAQRLQRAGIHTVSVQGYWYFFMNTGLERGFDVINKTAAPKLVTVDGDSNSNGDKVSDQALLELAKPELLQQPFFMWVHYIDPHSEYVRHEGFDFGSSSRQRYDGEVAFVDQQVGRVLDVLEKKPFYDHTAIIITSDHGEAFAEHGMIRHGFELWQELVRVPLIVRVPGVPAKHVHTPRSAIDLAPTILDLCGVPEPTPTASDFLSGTSLVPDLLLPKGTEPLARPIFIDMAAGPNNQDRQALIVGDEKLVASGGRPLSLYDLATDPGETKDLLDDSTRAQPMISKYKAFRRSLHEVYVKPE